MPAAQVARAKLRASAGLLWSQYMQTISGGNSDRPHKYDRGRLMSPAMIRTVIFLDNVTEAWVRIKAAPSAKIAFGGRVMWYEYDVLDWIVGIRDAN